MHIKFMLQTPTGRSRLNREENDLREIICEDVNWLGIGSSGGLL